jgi:hypothetical protein
MTAMFLTAALAGPVAAGEEVPFRGHFAGVATVTVNFPIASVDVDAAGNATQLGSFTLAIPHTVNLATMTSTGSYEFVAANGDTLSADFTGEVSQTATPGVLAAVESATITGGTGRFAGATGGFTVERLVDGTTVPRTTAGSFKGTISSPGAAGR